MWRRADWVVPYLNGAPYSDKPPLLFWGILAGWRVFGVNEWWPRLLSPLFGLLSALLLANLARRLSPERPDAADRALPFLSGMLWSIYSTLVLFDTLLTACVLVALCGVVEAARGRPGRGWLAYGGGIGLGVLAKGPVVLVHVLPVALLAPWWVMEPPRARWRRWYLGLMAGVALGAVIGLAWALSAAARGCGLPGGYALAADCWARRPCVRAPAPMVVVSPAARADPFSLDLVATTRALARRFASRAGRAGSALRARVRRAGIDRLLPHQRQAGSLPDAAPAGVCNPRGEALVRGRAPLVPGTPSCPLVFSPWGDCCCSRPDTFTGLSGRPGSQPGGD